MLRNPLPYLLLLLGLLVVGAACDNVGRAFDRFVDPNGPISEDGVSAIQIVPIGGDVRNGRPLVRETYPSGAGWPSTVPIVVEFSESLNEASILPTTPSGVDGRIGVRRQGTDQFLPAQYDFLANGRLLVIRPINGLSNQGVPIYEVVMLPEGRDVDGLRFQVADGEKVLSDFQVNQGESITDGSIVGVFPRDNFAEQMRGGDFYVFFDRPVTGGLEAANLFLQPSGGTATGATIDVPLTSVTITGVEEDPRVVRLSPTSSLLASANYDFTVTEGILFGADGKLDFNGRTPFSRFTTIAPSQLKSVELGNATAGFPDKVNRQNLLDIKLSVETGDETQVGDLIVGRIYGGNATTPETFDVAFIERVATAPTAGQQTVELDFATALGTVASPDFDQGDITFAAQIRSGNLATGFIHGSSATGASLDLIQPTLEQAGPPGSGVDIYADCDSLSYYGEASEGIAEASITDGVNTVSLFGASNSGRFLMQPLTLGRLTAARSYTLTLTDLAGNMSATAVSGQIRQRGQVTGALSGLLTVEAFDDATLLPIADATVLVDSSVPNVPATGQLIGTTDASGRATFSSGLSSSHTITIVRAGYDLVTIYGTQASLVSLPLSLTAGNTASLNGTVAFPPPQPPGVTVIVGTTGIADRGVSGISTTSSAATQIPTTSILPNRAQVITAFGGIFEPTGQPTFLYQACDICGPTLVDPTAPIAPPAVGETVGAVLGLLPAVAPIGAVTVAHSEDFGLAVGLDLANLVGGLPKSRVTSSLAGFSGQALAGIGSVSLQSGTIYDVNANYSLPIILGFGSFTPLSWLVTEAEDDDGRVSRVRALLTPDNGLLIVGGGPTPIPVITPPPGPFTGSPEVFFVDVLNPAAVPSGLGVGFVDMVAADSVGRKWRIIVPDSDTAGATDSVQFPDLATPGVAGLAPGAWQVGVEARLVLGLTPVSDIMLSDRFRLEVNYVRAQDVTFTVQ